MSETGRLEDGAELFCTAPPRPGTTAVVLLRGGPGLWDYLPNEVIGAAAARPED